MKVWLTCLATIAFLMGSVSWMQSESLATTYSSTFDKIWVVLVCVSLVVSLIVSLAGWGFGGKVSDD